MRASRNLMREMGANMRTLAVLMLLAVATPSVAQEVVDHPRRLMISEAAMAGGLVKEPPAPALQQRDSILNGTIIGAVIGAAVLGSIGTTFCVLLKEPGEPSCWRSFAQTGALGAVIGAGAGAGIDALRARPPALLPQPAAPEVPESLRRPRD